MTPKPENTTSYSLEPSPAYVNKGYVNNEKSSTCPAPTLEVTSTTTDVEVEKQPDGQVVQQRVIDFDDLLPHIGEFGRYQKILFLLMIPFAFFVAFVYFSQIFLTLVPDEHWCRVPELELFGNMTREERWGDQRFRWWCYIRLCDDLYNSPKFWNNSLNLIHKRIFIFRGVENLVLVINFQDIGKVCVYNMCQTTSVFTCTTTLTYKLVSSVVSRRASKKIQEKPVLER